MVAIAGDSIGAILHPLTILRDEAVPGSLRLEEATADFH
jgi:hypothetical protein